MVFSRNTCYSLACQTCRVENSDKRWQCAFCRLRVCEKCLRALQAMDRDLGSLLEWLEGGSQATSSSSRPSTSTSGGALGKVEEEETGGRGDDVPALFVPGPTRAPQHEIGAL